MTRLLLHEVFIKMKKLMHSFIHLVLFFYFELFLNSCSKEIFYVHLRLLLQEEKEKKRMKKRMKKKKGKEVCSKYFLFRVFCLFLKLLVKKMF